MVSLMKKYYMKHRNKLPDQVQLQFLRRLSQLLKKGYSLQHALQLIDWNERVKKIADSLTTSLINGQVLDEAFKREQFHPLIINYLYFVRFNNHLQSSLDKCILMFERRITYVKKFKQTIRYPLILLLIFSLLLFFIKNSIFPSFIQLFQSTDPTMSASFYLITIFEILIDLALLGLCIIGITFLVFFILKKYLAIEQQLTLYKKIPILNRIVKVQTTYFFAAQLSMFLKAGLPLKLTLQNMARQNQLPIIRHYTNLLFDHLQNGFLVSDLIAELFFLDDKLAHIFARHNNADDLEKELNVYAIFLAEDIDQMMVKYITVIQPLFFTMIAIFIIFVYLSIMLPMFQLINTI